MPDPLDRPELRLALGMRGGVSLAVWIGGACAEIDEMRRDNNFWRAILDACGYGEVVVDVMAGASAGGLNGVLFGSAIRHGFPMGELVEVWRGVASVNKLRRHTEPWLSLFDGDGRFLDVVRKELDERVAAASGTSSATYIDLQLAATMIEPISIAATSPEDEELRRTRSSATFHFRHDTTGVVPREDFGAAGAAASANARLALAARATSSFPVAFEAAVVRSRRADRFGQPVDGVPADPRFVDCRGVFSESRGRPSASAEMEDDDFVVSDGGIVDNIPLGKALDAVGAAPASGPTRRVLLYLHPTGPAEAPEPPLGAEPTIGGPPPSDAARAEMELAARRRLQVARRGVVAVGRGAFKARVESESIDGDLEQLEEHNRSVRLARMIRAVTAERLGDTTVGISVAAAWQTYRIQRPVADAGRLRRILDDPVVALGEDPFPSTLEDDCWRAPLTRWGPSARTELDTALSVSFANALSSAGPDGTIFLAGLASLRRTIDLLLEWTRAVGTDAADAAKKELYGLRSLTHLLERQRRLAWVVRAARATPIDAGDVATWCGLAVHDVDRLLRVNAAVANKLVAGDAETGLRYAAAVDEAIQSMVEGELVEPNVASPADGWLDGAFDEIDGGTDLRAKIRDRAAKLVKSVLDSRAGVHLPKDAPAWLIDRALVEHAASPVLGLAAIEVLCLPEHLAGSPGGSEIRFFRISAAAETPLAAEFERLRRATVDARPDAPAHYLRPDTKLAGNELSNFSAFLDARWRLNDWMWGRMDATSALVDVLLDDFRADPSTLPPQLLLLAGIADAEPNADSLKEVRRFLVAGRQRAIVEEMMPSIAPGASLATYDVGLESITKPGSSAIQASLVELVTTAAYVVNDLVPRPARRLVAVAGFVGRTVTRRLAQPTVAEPTTGGSRTKLGVRIAIALAAGLLVGVVAFSWAASKASFLVGLGVTAIPVLALLGFVYLQQLPKPSPPAADEAGADPHG